MKKSIVSVAALLVLGVGGWYVFTHGASGMGGGNSAVATVNGENITQSDLISTEAQLAAQQGVGATTTEARAPFVAAALESLVSQTLLRQAATKAGITASSTGVDTQMQSIKSQFKTDAEYKQALASRLTTEAQLRTQIQNNLLIQMYLSKAIDSKAATTTEAEIKAAYDAVAAQQTGLPPLSAVHSQVAQMLVQQKQQKLVADHIAKLRADGQVKILISTSTPSK